MAPESKKQGDQLWDSRVMLESLFEESPSYISVQDRDLRIVKANRRFREDFGDRVGDRCYRVYKHREEQCRRCPVIATFEDHESHHSEEVVTTLSGRQVHTAVSTAPLSVREGEPPLVMEMSTDITRITELQGQLSNLGLLISSMSHGLRGLLTGMDGGAYLITSGMKKDRMERVEQGWQMVQRNMGHIRRVVMDLLYLAGEGEDALTATALGALGRAIVAAYDKRASDLDIDFRAEIDDGGGTCEIDAGALEASISNILEFSLEACRLDQGRADHAVLFRLTWDDDNAYIEIRDNGIGMDRETLQKVFSPFFSSEVVAGTSLGLFTANKVIEKHRGVIEVSSELRAGTVFRIRLPRVQEPGLTR